MKKIITIFALALAVLVSAIPAEAQQGKMRRIGLLTPLSPLDSAPWYEAFRQGLLKLGWAEGKNIHIEYRYARGNRKRLPALAKELVGLKAELIVTLQATRSLTSGVRVRRFPSSWRLGLRS